MTQFAASLQSGTIDLHSDEENAIRTMPPKRQRRLRRKVFDEDDEVEIDPAVNMAPPIAASVAVPAPAAAVDMPTTKNPSDDNPGRSNTLPKRQRRPRRRIFERGR